MPMNSTIWGEGVKFMNAYYEPDWTGYNGVEKKRVLLRVFLEAWQSYSKSAWHLDNALRIFSGLFITSRRTLGVTLWVLWLLPDYISQIPTLLWADIYIYVTLQYTMRFLWCFYDCQWIYSLCCKCIDVVCLTLVVLETTWMSCASLSREPSFTIQIKTCCKQRAKKGARWPHCLKWFIHQAKQSHMLQQKAKSPPGQNKKQGIIKIDCDLGRRV